MDRVTAAPAPQAEEAGEFLDPALVEEAARKSGLLWVSAGGAPARPLWHVWQDGAVVVVGDGAEQPLHGLADGQDALVTARSKDKGGRLAAWPVRVVELAPGGDAWRAAVEELKGKRLNAPDTDTVTDRWARECRVLRLETAGPTAQRPGAMPDGSHAARPLPSAATTRRPVPAGLPRLLLRRRGR
ncbi:hypothetical protein LO771_25530 [Streptacidiphilus sp. ASG 303]|uniref:hypothetical protein n=1 Tax=Streptacidiphilus sp. ASG 303 TaxID=2896847 RepID=UPI001E2B5AAF|nr:hypothetical protein [Streptacidiphilus sp. ASG 303]MCD0485659.1 hypothetical protein [Streptacidiphilus sp. ASG 303]